MPNEDVTVSLSRLALAKAIKTPDAGEEEAEPWNKSIIFHQAHIDAQMRNSILNPQSQQSNTRRKGGARSNPKQQQQQRNPQRYPSPQQRPPPMNRVRSEESQQRIHQYQQQQPIKQVNNNLSAGPRPASTSSGSNNGQSSLSSGKMANNNSMNTLKSRKFVPSDDEEEEEDESEEEESSDEEEQVKPKQKVIPQTKVMNKSESSQNVNKTTKGKGKALPQPSDDEESEEEDTDGDEQADEMTNKVNEEEDEQMYARRMSTLRQLERGPSTQHRRTRSTGDMDEQIPPVAQPTGKLGTIEQWRMTVMEADDVNSTGTPPSNESLNAPLTEEDDEEEDDLVEEPIVRVQPLATPPIPFMANNNRASTLGDMDMFYFQQQQQQQIALHNMQMQQAMQLQQAQQYAQIQQYQAMQLQQQQQQKQYHSMSALDNNTRKANNRKSVSAMDLMLQLEQEKAATRKQPKKKLPDPSKAQLGDGLLGKVPEPGQHNYNFQQHQQMKPNSGRKTMTRASKSDYNIHQQQQQQQSRSNRPPSTLMMYENTNRHSRVPMIRSDSSPIPQISMSTPLGGNIQQQQYMIPPQMVMQQQQHMQPPNMNPSRSSQYISKPSNHPHRQSNFSGYDF